MIHKNIFLLALLISLISCFMIVSERIEAADPFPEKDVTFMIGYSAGGGTDLITLR